MTCITVGIKCELIQRDLAIMIISSAVIFGKTLFGCYLHVNG